jgi:putative flippase GtrA
MKNRPFRIFSLIKMNAPSVPQYLNAVSLFNFSLSRELILRLMFVAALVVLCGAVVLILLILSLPHVEPASTAISQVISSTVNFTLPRKR